LEVFRETQSGNVDDTIREYSTAIQDSGTALLFSVISGKLSEGINFSDSLCRLILLIGIPYPNPHTPESKARQSYLETSLRETLSLSADEARRRAAEVGEDSALRAVNQAIGRAIRHGGDWAGIVLVDERWGRERVRGKLSGWIRENLQVTTGFGEVVGKIGGFFRGKRVVSG
jgi:chromosome transmission fidelity protein 1